MVKSINFIIKKTEYNYFQTFPNFEHLSTTNKVTWLEFY